MNQSMENELSIDQKEMLEALKGVVRIPSVKGRAEEGAPFGRETVQALDYMLNLGKNMGFKVCSLDGFAGYIEFGEGSREVAVLCHLDVVPAGEGWAFDPFTPFIRDGKIFGRGTNDDKGPAIATLYAMKSLKDSGYCPPCRIRLVLGLDEESGSECMVHYKKTQAMPQYGFTPDAKFPVIYAEKGILHATLKGTVKKMFPTAAPVVLLSAKGGERANMIPASCKFTLLSNPDLKIISKEDVSNLSGSIEMKVITGVPGHASMPEFGVNAISKAMVEIGSLLDASHAVHPFVDFYNKSVGMTTDGSLLGIHCSDKESGSLTCNVGLLDLDADQVSMTLDIRYPVTANSETILALLQSKCAPWGLTVTNVTNTPPLHVGKNSDFVRTLLKIYNGETGEKAEPVAIGGGTYARSIPNIVAFGPNFTHEDDVAHQAGEYMKLKDLFLCCDIYRKALQSLAEMAVVR